MTDMADNHKEAWEALINAADKYRTQTGNDIVLITAYKTKFVPPYGYHVHGNGVLLEATQRYVDDIAVVHKTTAFTSPLPITKTSTEATSGRQNSYSKSYPSIYGKEGIPTLEDNERPKTPVQLPEPLPLLNPPEEDYDCNKQSRLHKMDSDLSDSTGEALVDAEYLHKGAVKTWFVQPQLVLCLGILC